MSVRNFWFSLAALVGAGFLASNSSPSIAQNSSDGIIQKLETIMLLLERFDERITALEAKQARAGQLDDQPQFEEGVIISVYGRNEKILPAAGPAD